jgi:hypothetical protein
LCGILGASDHWADAVPRPGVFTRNTDSAARRRERMHRVAAANRILKHYGMTLVDWQGGSFVLSTTSRISGRLPSGSLAGRAIRSKRI